MKATADSRRPAPRCRLLRLIGSAARSRLTGSPYKLNVHLTWKCNSRCRHCSIWQRPAAGDELDADEYRRIFARMPRLAILSITGGQPTLRRDLDRIILAATELLPKLSVVSVNTNALTPPADVALVETVLSECPGLRFDVSISLDGLRETHDAIRGVPGNFAKIEDLVARLRGVQYVHRGLRIGLSTTITRTNLDELEALVGVFPEKDFHTFDFYATSEAYYGEPSPEGMALNDRDLARARRVLRTRKARSIEDLLNRMFVRLAGFPRRQPACTAGTSAVSIYPDGQVKRCYFLTHSIGRLREVDYDLPKLLRENKRELRRPCKECWNTCNAYTTLIARPFRALVSLVR